MNHAMYTVQTRRGYYSMCFLIEPWRIKENLVMAENIPKRLTVLLCVNSDESDKQVPIVIGKSPIPSASRMLKNCQLNTTWTVKHGRQQRFFCSFLHNLEAQNRQIILFVDNCAAHPKDTSFLRNVKVVRYPANCTSMLQPLDLGIIHSLKAYYRKRLVQTSLCLMESGKEVQKKLTYSKRCTT